MDEGNRFIDSGIKASQDLVKLLKRQEAFENHGLAEGKYSYPFQLEAAIKNNEPQFEEALNNQRSANPDELASLISNLENVIAQTDIILEYAEALANAEWKTAAIKPTDNKAKWVALTTGSKNFLKSYLEKNAFYDLQADKWVFDGKTADETFTIYKWTEAPVAKPAAVK